MNHPNRRKRPIDPAIAQDYANGKAVNLAHAALLGAAAQDYANGKAVNLAHAALLGAAQDYANGKVPVLTLQNAAVRYRDATDADQKHSAAFYAARIAARTPRRSDR